MHQQARNNTHMRLIVEQGVAHDMSHGSVAAWRFLAANGVPEALILRVLSDPARRRESDNLVQPSHAPLSGAHGGTAANNAVHSPLGPGADQ